MGLFNMFKSLPASSGVTVQIQAQPFVPKGTPTIPITVTVTAGDAAQVVSNIKATLAGILPHSSLVAPGRMPVSPFVILAQANSSEQQPLGIGETKSFPLTIDLLGEAGLPPGLELPQDDFRRQAIDAYAVTVEVTLSGIHQTFSAKLSIPFQAPAGLATPPTSPFGGPVA